MTTGGSDDQFLRTLIEAAGERLDPNTIAAAADRQAYRPEVAGLRRDPEAVLVMRQLARGPARRRRLLGSGAALAACVVVGAVLWVLRQDRLPGPERVATRLARAVEDLRSAHPAQFHGLTCETPATRDTPSGHMRGGALWLGPRGTVLQSTAVLRWRNPASASGMLVTLKGPGRNLRRAVEGESLQISALSPGRYVVTLRALDGFAGQTLRRTFRVAAEAERAHYDSARALWQTNTSPDLHDLIEAHYALSTGFHEAARAAARRAAERDGRAAALARALLESLER